MTFDEKQKQQKGKFYAEVASYVFANPGVGFDRVAEKYGLSHSTVSRVAVKAGMAARRPGRKPTTPMPPDRARTEANQTEAIWTKKNSKQG